MKREQALKVVLALVGLIFSAAIYPRFRESKCRASAQDF